MSKPVIIVDTLSKSYRIGHKAQPLPTFRDAVVEAVKAPWQRLRGLARGAVTTTSETFWALKDVSFEVQKGEVVGIIGRNGAGKSTLLKILSRIAEPTSGRVRMRGRVASLLEVGTGFHPELTGRENIFLNGAILGMRREEIKRKFDEMVAFAEVEKFLDTPVKFYSSGMYVRLAFAVAAHLEPEILIVDEVLAVGDAEFQKKCLGKMREVSHGCGRTVLFVSHNMAAVQGLCGRGVEFGNGRALAIGPIGEVVSGYMGRKRHVDEVFKAGMVGSIYVEHVYVRGKGGEIRTLEDAIVSFVLTPSVDISSLGLRLFIETEDGNGLIDLDPYPAHPRCPLKSGVKVRLDVELKALPLRPGKYVLRVVLQDDGRFENHELEQTIGFPVEASLDPKVNNAKAPVNGPVALAFSRIAHEMEDAAASLGRISEVSDRSKFRVMEP